MQNECGGVYENHSGHPPPHLLHMPPDPHPDTQTEMTSTGNEPGGQTTQDETMVPVAAAADSDANAVAEAQEQEQVQDHIKMEDDKEDLLNDSQVCRFSCSAADDL